MYQWVKIFKLLGNENRLRILRLLSRYRELPVKEISDKLCMTQKLASQYLVLLSHANIVRGKGKLAGVHYSLDPDLPEEVKQIISKFIHKSFR